MNFSADFFRLLGDPQRLRLLRLLSREKLNVSELTQIFGGAQSGISRHLRKLKEADLIREDRERGWTYYKVDARRFSDGIAGIWPALEDQLVGLEGTREDDVRLHEILRQRKEEFREQSTTVAPSPGRSWAAWARTLSYVAPPVVVADLGCGEGYLTLEVARWAKQVVAVDQSDAMLDRLKELARKQRVRNVKWKKAQIENLPLADESVDIVLMSQVLHALQDPGIGLSQAYRILKREGLLLVQDLRKHEEEWVKEKHGDIWLGFETTELRSMLRNAGFSDVRVEIGSRRRGDPFMVLIGRGKKFADDASRPSVE
jgi:DNA-binding transcriptional ArsR family regulator